MTCFTVAFCYLQVLLLKKEYFVQMCLFIPLVFKATAQYQRTGRPFNLFSKTTNLTMKSFKNDIANLNVNRLFSKKLNKE